VEVGFAQVDTKFAQMETKIEVGFAQVDTKLAQAETKMEVGFAQVDTKLAKVEGDITLLRQPRDFAEFLKRAIASGMVVTVFGGLLLAAGKLLIFGNI
jgi:hypothetical protein